MSLNDNEVPSETFHIYQKVPPTPQKFPSIFHKVPHIFSQSSFVDDDFPLPTKNIIDEGFQDDLFALFASHSHCCISLLESLILLIPFRLSFK